MGDYKNMNNKKKVLIFLSIVLIIAFSILLLKNNNTIETISKNVNTSSNKKICWGIKRNDNNKQPDLGSENKALIDKYDGIAIRKC